MTSEQRVLCERYRLLRNMGKGGMGTVWLAEDELLQRAVALKELVWHAGPAGLTERRARAMQEARALARMNHPAIVPIHDVVLDGADPWIVMQYIRGRSLEDILAAGPLSERDIAAIGLPVLHALTAAHQAGVIHRDVKPTNILVADDGSTFLVDFGIARIDGDTRLTGHTSLVGTTEFLAPERIRGEEIRPAADLWSFGVTLFLALEGHSPFRRGNRDATMYAIVHEDPPVPRRRGPLAQLILDLLRRNWAARPDAGHVDRALQSILAGPQPPGPGPVPGAGPWPARGRVFGPAAEPGALPRDDRPTAASAREDMAAARKVIREVSTDAGAAMLARMRRGDAAQILLDYDDETAGGLLQGVATTQPDVAAQILQIFLPVPASRILGQLRPDAAAAVLQAMPPTEAVRVLALTGDLTAAAALMHLRAGAAAGLLGDLPADQAGRICRRMAPAAVAAMADEDPNLIGRLLDRAGPGFRDQVRRCRGHALPGGTSAAAEGRSGGGAAAVPAAPRRRRGLWQHLQIWPLNWVNILGYCLGHWFRCDWDGATCSGEQAKAHPLLAA
jgi:flagellar motility protein MotE (MotC chaperone)/predicted Ser/Thr protein kinase